MIFLAIGAHPDDIDYTAGGTVAKLTAAGQHQVHYCLVTNGQAGGEDPTVSRLEQAEHRRKEQEAAADVLGVASSHHLDLADGLLEPSLDLRRVLTKVIRQVKPDIIFAPSPRYNLDNVHFLHPDHLAVGQATLSAVYPDARNKFAFPEVCLAPHSVKQVWLVEDTDPDFFVEISKTMDKKLQALREHSSQFATNSDLASQVSANAQRFAALADEGLDNAEGYRRIIYADCDLDL